MDGVRSSDVRRAIDNLRQEIKGDWYRDPWSWPEYDFIIRSHGRQVRDRLEDMSVVRDVAEIDVPKENFGLRPAMVLDILDRIAYQTLVDRVSVDVIGGLSPQAYGWRLPFKPKGRGVYARQDYQWQRYKSVLSHYSGVFEAGLKTDISACFSSIPIEGIANQLISSSSQTAAVDKIIRMLHGWERVSSRTGLPQRSTASAVLANMYLAPLDDVLRDHARILGRLWPTLHHVRSSARWMDDMWLFSNDQAKLRKAQVDLQSAVHQLRMVLNSGKTKVFVGDDLQEAARKIQASAVDDALELKNAEPLHKTIDGVLDSVEVADRSVIKFVTTRMRRHHERYRLDDFLEAAPRMPHAADSLSRMFREMLSNSEIQDWLLDYVDGEWNTFEWSLSQFGTALSSRRKPRSTVRRIFEAALADRSTSLPLLAVSAQRLSAWDPTVARGLIVDRVAGEESSQVVRVLSLAALSTGEPPRSVRRWLRLHESNALTLRMLESEGFNCPPLSQDYK